MSSSDDKKQSEAKNVNVDSGDAWSETMDMSGDTGSAAADLSQGLQQKWIGKRLGKYEVTGVLGIGGMGAVLKAHDASIERDVALKVLTSELSEGDVALGRLLAEAKSAGKLNHPNTITVYEIGEQDGTHYIAMEIAPGGSVEDHLEKTGPYSLGQATRIATEACLGLSAAHQAGLVHRDIKPANLLFTKDGVVKVCDFGLAKRTQNHSLQLTQAGQVMGTPYFMSPEQCQSGEVDARSDIYSLGATYYSLLTGKMPYEDRGSVVQLMFAHCNADPPDPRDILPEIPVACSNIVGRAMATDPADRYQTAKEMRTDLEAVMAAISGAAISLPSQVSAQATPSTQPSSNQAQTGSRWPLWLGGLGLAVALGVVGFFMSGLGSTKDTGEEPASPDSPPVVAAPTGEPIKLGILHSLSGTMASSESPVVNAALLAVDQINRDGGVLGRPVEAIVVDGRSNDSVFAQESTRLIQEEKVCTVLGCWTSSSRKTVVPIFEELDHLLLYPVQYEGIEESPNVIYLGAAPNQQIIPAVKWAYAFDSRRRFFLVGSDYVFPRVAHEIIKDQLEELGAELAGEAFLPLGSMDVDAVVSQIKAQKPDVILNSINGNSNAAFFAALRKEGITPAEIPTISFSIGEAELKQMDAASMAGDYAAWNYFQSIASPENDTFVAELKKKYGPQCVLTDPMEAAYFGVKVWAEAVEEAASTEPPAIRRALRNQRMRAPEGDIRIDPATQHTFKTPRIGKVQSDGQFEIIWTDAKPIAPSPYPSSRTAETWRAFLNDLYTGWGNQWIAPNTP